MLDALLSAAEKDLGSRNRSEPLYEQLAKTLAEEIKSGRIAPGEKLPTHRELASRLQVNITTIAPEELDAIYAKGTAEAMAKKDQVKDRGARVRAQLKEGKGG